MSGKGPIATLLSGLLFAAIIVLLNLNAAKPAAGPYGAPSPAGGTAGPPAPAASSPAASPTSNATAPTVNTVTKATYAGHTDGKTASIAISIHNGVAIAYLCSGKIESWLQGTAKDGKLALTGTHSGTLTGTFDASGAHGTAVASGKTFTFTAAVVHAPSGLWRSAATVRNAKVVAGWIVLPDGSQIGMVDVGGVETQAPPLDADSHSATVSGTTITASPIDGESGSGF
jgi:hypothetical protein